MGRSHGSLYVGVRENERAREGMVVLLNELCYTVLECVSSEVLWIKFNYDSLRICGCSV